MNMCSMSDTTIRTKKGDWALAVLMTAPDSPEALAFLAEVRACAPPDVKGLPHEKLVAYMILGLSQLAQKGGAS